MNGPRIGRRAQCHSANSERSTASAALKVIGSIWPTFLTRRRASTVRSCSNSNSNRPGLPAKVVATRKGAGLLPQPRFALHAHQNIDETWNALLDGQPGVGAAKVCADPAGRGEPRGERIDLLDPIHTNNQFYKYCLQGAF